MAPLTWRNVSAPDFQGASSMMDVASRGWDRAFSGMRDALYRQGEVNRQNRSAELLPLLANATDQESADAAIAAFSQMAPHHVSPELAQAIMGLREQAQEFEMNQLRMSAARRGSGSAAQDAATDAVIASVIAGQAGGGQQGEGAAAAPSAEATEGGSPFARSGRPSIVPQTMGTTDLSFGAPAPAQEPTYPLAQYQGFINTPPISTDHYPSLLEHYGERGASEIYNPAVRPYVGRSLLMQDGVNTPPLPPQSPQQSPQPDLPAEVAAAPVPLSVQPTAPGAPVVSAQPVSERLTFGNPAPLVAPAAPAPAPAVPQTSVAAPNAPSAPDGAGFNSGTFAGSTPQGLPTIHALLPSQVAENAAAPWNAAIANVGNTGADVEALVDARNEAVDDAVERAESDQSFLAQQQTMLINNENIVQERIETARAQQTFNDELEAELVREEAQNYVVENFALYGDRASFEGALVESGLPMDRQLAYLSAWDALQENMPSVFELPEQDVEMSRMVEAAIARVTQDTDTRLNAFPALRAAQAASSVDMNMSTVDFLAGLNSNGLNIDLDQTLTVANRIRRDHGFSPAAINAAILNNVVGNGWFDGISNGWAEGNNQLIGVNEDALLEELQAGRDPSVLPDNIAFLNERNADIEQLQTLGERLLGMDQRLSWFQERFSEEELGSHEAYQTLLAEYNETSASFGELSDSIELVQPSDLPGYDPTTDPTEIARLEALEQQRLENERIANEAMQAALDSATNAGASIPTPRGYIVDPTASAASQAWNGFMRDSEISAAITGIRRDLNLFGSEDNQSMFDFVNFFRPSGEAQRSQATRQSHMMARDWYDTQAARNLFLSNPGLIEEARQDPIGFFVRHMEAPSPR